MLKLTQPDGKGLVIAELTVDASVADAAWDAGAAKKIPTEQLTFIWRQMILAQVSRELAVQLQKIQPPKTSEQLKQEKAARDDRDASIAAAVLEDDVP